MKRLTQAEFEAKANEIHGGFYEYDKAIVKGVKAKVVITCPVHGDFEQSPEMHLKGYGCRKCAVEKRKATMVSRYGVEAALQSEELLGKFKATKEARYGRQKPEGSGRRRLSLDEFVRRATEIHGGKYDYSRVRLGTTQDKVEIVCPLHGPFLQTPNKHLAGHGCLHKECRDAKRAAANEAQRAGGKEGLSRSGASPRVSSRLAQEKRERTMMERYGVRNPMQSPAIKARHAAVCQERYDAPSPLGSPGITEKRIATMNARYGGNGPMCSPDIVAKRDATVLERYGVRNVMQSDEVKARFAKSLLDRYGADNPMRVEDFKKAQRDGQARTMSGRYGADSGFGSAVLREKAQATNLARYGVRNPMVLKAFADKMIRSKIERGTMRASMPEEDLYGLLLGAFGEGDVVRQYRDEERYPFACDFYVPSRDLFIELNANWTHGGYWYDEEQDADRLAEMSQKAKRSEFYGAMIHIWTVSDAEKRRMAAEHGLNYLVLWDNDLRDAKLWFAAGCPDARDWDRPYSWLEEEGSYEQAIDEG